jgi:hypothetical protein
MSLVSALQIPYRESREGFWGKQTSTLNWCEEVSNLRQCVLLNSSQTSYLGDLSVLDAYNHISRITTFPSTALRWSTRSPTSFSCGLDGGVYVM